MPSGRFSRSTFRVQPVPRAPFTGAREGRTSAISAECRLDGRRLIALLRPITADSVNFAATVFTRIRTGNRLCGSGHA